MKPARRDHWTLRQRVTRSAIAALVLFAALFGVITASLVVFKHRGDQVIDRWEPTYSTSQALFADLVGQETAVRGYAISGDETLLNPYGRYRTQQATDTSAVRGALGGQPGLQQELAAFTAAADAWRAQVAVPVIARVRAGDRSVGQTVVSPQSRAAFARIRAASVRLTDGLRAVRDRSKAERLGAVDLVWAAVGVSAALILLAGVLLVRGLRRSVLEPVERLADQARQVASGAIDQHIVGTGPPELAALGRDVDTMRARIASELARVEQARIRLMERGEELARSNADLEQFAYVASHDLSEPLRKVSNFCQLLERQYADQLDDKARQYIAFAVDGAKRMQVLITDLLSFSRVGRTTEAFEPVSTDAALGRALTHLEDRVTASGAEIVRGPLPVVDGDPSLLVALFQNLVGNSLKYASPERPPRVEVTAERTGPDWLFTVTDNGIGIERQYAERIFTIFQRLHLRDEYGGTGIGLALCRKIVEFHRGRIWLADYEGPGARFQFTIPERGEPRNGADG